MPGGGRLEVTVGPMFASKSTLALRDVNRWRKLGACVLAIKHAGDVERYGEGIRTHDRHKTDAVAVKTLMGLLGSQPYRDADVLVIDEAQWFADAVDFCRFAVDDGKKVYVYGLDGTVAMGEFPGRLHEMCRYADRFEKVMALCQMCGDGTPAPFTIAFGEMPGDFFQPGGSETYAPVCRRHHAAHSRAAPPQ